MPPKKNPETQAEQSKRFKKDAQNLVDAGELNLTEADAALDGLVTKQRNPGRGDSKRKATVL